MLDNKTLLEFIEHKQKLVDANLNYEQFIQGKEYDLSKCLNGTCEHKRFIAVCNTIKLNENDYSIELINLADDEEIKVCLKCLNILSPLNDVFYFKSLLTINELEEKSES